MRFLQPFVRSRKRSHPRRPVSRPKKRSALRLELLEDRCLPSIVLDASGNLWVNCDTPTEQQGGNAVTLATSPASSADIYVSITDQFGNVEEGTFAGSAVNHIYADGSAVGSDTFWVLETLATAPVSIDSFANTGGPNDSVFIGNAESVQFIQGTVDIYDPNGSTTVRANDAADSTARTVYLFTFNYPDDPRNLGTIRGLAPADIHYYYATTSSVLIDTGHGGDTVNVEATGTTTYLVGNDLTTVNVSAGGTLTNIAGPVNVSNSSGGGTTLNVDDSGDPTANTTTTITNSSVSGSWSAAAINYTASQVSSLTFHSGTGGNTINVQSTGATTNLVGNSGGTTVNVGKAGSVQGIAAALNIENPPSFDNINIDDSADPGTRTALLSLLGTNPVDSEANFDRWGQISSLAPGNINYEYGDVGTVTVNGALGGTTFQVNDVPNVAMILNGTGGANTLDGPNQANLWTLDAALGGILDSNITFSDIQNLVGGTGGDTFDLASPVPISSNIMLNSLSTLNVAANAPAANLLLNAGFDTVGPAGSPVTYVAPVGGLSAAADWYQFMGGPLKSSATTELLPSTDNLPGGGGQMLHFSTNGGLKVSSANGVFEVLPVELPPGAVGSFDINVPAGTSGVIGFANSILAPFRKGTLAFGPTLGWQHVTVQNLDNVWVNEIGFEVFSKGGGQVYLDNAFASPSSSGAQFLTGGINNNGHLLAVTGAGKLTLEGVLSGSGGLSMQGTGTLTLAAGNSFTGNTSIASGTVTILHDAALGAAGTSTTVASGATLAISGVNYATPENLFLNGSGVGGVGGLENLTLPSTFAGPITLSSNSTIADTVVAPPWFLSSTTLTLTGTISNGGHLLTVAGPGTFEVTGVISGSGGLKQNKGTLILSANNTYTGPTTTNGTLVVNGSLPSSGMVTVNSGGLLAGTGSVGAVTVNNGGTVAPGPLGGKGMGTLTVASANFSLGGTLLIHIPAYGTPGVNYDQLNVTGTLTLGGTSKLTLDLMNGLSTPGTASGIVLYASHSGTFATKKLIHNVHNRSINSLNYNPTSLDVVFS